MGSCQGSDERLVERARDGDRVAQQELWRAHRRWVAAVILAHRPRSSDLEDLMQEVAVKLVAKIHTLRAAAAFRPWLRRIAINACRGAARGSQHMLRLDSARDGTRRDPGSAAEPVAPGDEQAAMENSDAAGRLLERALGLPVAYREPLLLRCLRSMSYEQIGAILDLPVTTVETRLARARRMLREEVEAAQGASRAAAQRKAREERGDNL